MKKFLSLSSLAISFFIAAAAGISHAQTANLLKQHKDWSAFAYTASNGKVCFVSSEARDKKPTTLTHGDVVFFVTHRNGENIRAEPYLRTGYSFKSATPVSLDVDGRKFTMVTDGNGAWIPDKETESALLDAMKRGSKMRVSAISGKGNKTTYLVSLSGITAAMKEIDAACS